MTGKLEELDRKSKNGVDSSEVSGIVADVEDSSAKRAESPYGLLIAIIRDYWPRNDHELWKRP